MQAVGSAEDPSSSGRQMPSHWGSKLLNIVTQSSATGSQCIPAVGCAEASRYIVRRPQLTGCAAQGDELTYVSLGEGACSEGEFWESLNTACNLHLPVLFVVEDNGFAISVPSSDQQPAPVAEVGPTGWLGDVVRRLPDRVREPVVLHYYADLSVEAVAIALRRPVGTVKRQLSEARELLAQMLREDDR